MSDKLLINAGKESFDLLNDLNLAQLLHTERLYRLKAKRKRVSLKDKVDSLHTANTIMEKIRQYKLSYFDRLDKFLQEGVFEQ